MIIKCISSLTLVSELSMSKRITTILSWKYWLLHIHCINFVFIYRIYLLTIGIAILIVSDCNSYIVITHILEKYNINTRGGILNSRTLKWYVILIWFISIYWAIFVVQVKDNPNTKYDVMNMCYYCVYVLYSIHVCFINLNSI